MTNDDRWRAVLARDSGLDGVFVFAVTSTGIYCRPSCPARRPRRTNVRFYGLPEAAEAAGFRACRRCRPRGVSIRDTRTKLVRRVCRAIDSAQLDTPTVKALAAGEGVSTAYLQRTFKQTLGMTPRDYIDARRFRRLKRSLRAGSTVSAAQFDAGFGSSRALYERASEHLGMTPASYQRGGRGARIRYGVAACSLGRVIVARTARGICAVRLGDTEAELRRELESEFPAADLRRDDTALEPVLQQIVTACDGESVERPADELPLDIVATAFQWAVWHALRAIPAGETRTYSEIARAVGSPKAVRAVGNACAANPLAVVIPCHRVAREDGSLGGYRWGVERKRELLERERREASAQQL